MRESTRCVVANVLDCDIVVSKFELKSRFYIHSQTDIIGKSMNFRIVRSYGLSCITTVTQPGDVPMGQIILWQDGFGII